MVKPEGSVLRLIWDAAMLVLCHIQLLCGLEQNPSGRKTVTPLQKQLSLKALIFDPKVITGQ